MNNTNQYCKKLNIPICNLNIVSTFVPICLEDALATLFEYKGIKYKSIFAFSWDFIFAIDWIKTEKLGEAFLVDYFKKKIFTYLRKIYNIDIHLKKFENRKEEYKQYLLEQIAQDNPVLVQADSYYLEWSTFYHKQHAEHILLLIGIDENDYYIIDAIDSNEVLKIEKEYFHNISKYIFEYDLSNVSSEELISIWSDDFYQELGLRENICPDIAFDNILEFAEYFEMHFSHEIEFEGADLDSLYDSVFMNAMRHLVAARNLFLVWLESEYAEKQNEIIKEIIEKIRTAIRKWITVQNILYKSAITNWKGNYKEKIIKNVIAIERIEREAYQLLERVGRGINT